MATCLPIRGATLSNSCMCFGDGRAPLAHGIFMTPTLVKLAPSPTRRIVGTLSQPQPVLQPFGLEPLSA
ncbi:MAG: circadian clock KaiB family protein [Burkholderiales bacterium]